jgi:hypothetical protein
MRLQGTSVLLMTLCLVGSTRMAAGQDQTKQEDKRKVYFNRVRLSGEELAALTQKYRIFIRDGSYWYDRMSGAWGIEGGPTLGIGYAGLNLGGPLRADASNGRTGVFINGRQIHEVDKIALSQLGPVIPGRYWVDALGNCGYEGGPAFVNLVYLANIKNGQGRGLNGCTYSNNSTYCNSGEGGSITFKDPTGQVREWGR